MALTTQKIASQLNTRARVQPSEGFDLSFLGQLVDAALIEHNSSLTIDTLPDNQGECVLLLAWIRLCYDRASSIVNNPNVSSASSGFGSDRNTPFQKNLQLAKSLRDQYISLCQSIGIDPSPEPNSIFVSSLIVSDPLKQDMAVPLSAAPTPPSPVLSVVSSNLGSSEVIIAWTFSEFDFFKSFTLFNLQGTDPIRQDWNFSSQSSYPKINNIAQNLGTFYVEQLRSVKVTEVDLTQVQRFILVATSLSQTYSYSNEVVITPAP